jgi:hypothetical protein
MTSRVSSPLFRFTIRDVLWLTVVVGLAVGWLLDRRILASKLSSLEAEKSRAEAAALGTYNEYDKVMRIIKESGQALIWHPDGTTSLEKSP